MVGAQRVRLAATSGRRPGLGGGTRRLAAERLGSGHLVELSLEAYPFTQWKVGLDLIWHSAAKPGKAATWLRVEIGKVKLFS